MVSVLDRTVFDDNAAIVAAIGLLDFRERTLGTGTGSLKGTPARVTLRVVTAQGIKC